MCVLAALLWIGVFAQTFEVASVKRAAPYRGGPIHIAFSGGPGTEDPGRVTFSNATVMMILVTAFEKESYQIVGPDWISDDMFDIVAQVPDGSTRQQMLAMVRNLVADRFRMASHTEKRDLPSYVLTVGKSGPKMNPTTAAAKPRTTSPAAGIQKLTCGGCSMAQFVSALGNPLGRPIFDRTGLTGSYDFTLTWEPEFLSRPGMAGPPPPSLATRDPSAEGAPLLPTAVQDQLGLKLELKKIPTDVLVIDRIERTPVGN